METREETLFRALDVQGDGHVLASDVIGVLLDAGLDRNDPRLSDLFRSLDQLASAHNELDLEKFVEILGPSGLLLDRVIKGRLAVPDFKDFSNRVKAMFSEVETIQSGNQADYIPPLQEVNPDQFGIAIVTVDGQVFTHGDAAVDFSIQSTCKPFNYCFAAEELGPDKVHQHVGQEPSGRPFNAHSLLKEKRPHNPMINAGAIMSAALIKTDLPVHRRLDHVRQSWARMTGGELPRYNAWMAKEENRTGDTNRSLAYMMKSRQVFPRGEDAVDHEIRDALELYFSTCSLEMTCRELGTATATLANGGVCPLTQERVLSRPTVRNCLALMQMCGMYDYSGEFCFRIGLPAKSGVGGAVVLVVPNLMGICIWSPRLDEIGNSVRAVEMAARLTDTYNLHLYDSISAAGDRIDPRVPLAQWRASLTSQALWAASKGDVWTLRRLHEEQMDLQQGDYDLRSPLHLAAAEGHLEAVKFLLSIGIEPNQKDRWGGTPLEDAQNAGHQDIIELLKTNDAVASRSQHISSKGSSDEPFNTIDTDAVVELLWAASEGSIRGLQSLVAQGVNVNSADYDGRTALHLAASEGHLDAVKYLIVHGHALQIRDRWHATPLDEAKREERSAVVEFLEQVVEAQATRAEVAPGLAYADTEHASTDADVGV
ncbi:MAG: glutaminase A [Myxococcota bacterium]|nr:glutaminase A [Myxococcota bacterium]